MCHLLAEVKKSLYLSVLLMRQCQYVSKHVGEHVYVLSSLNTMKGIWGTIYVFLYSYQVPKQSLPHLSPSHLHRHVLTTYLIY